jgi:hypothetical protein
LYGPHLMTGNTLVDLKLGVQYCKHPVYPYDVVMSFLQYITH